MQKKPTEILVEEHRVIQKVVGTMAVIVEAFRMDVKTEPELLLDIALFMRTFADKCHHGKEEVHLFPVLERKGVPMHGCPIGALLAEHQAGRELVRTFTEAAEAYAKEDLSAKKPLVESLSGLAGLYPGHIWKEDYLLFPMTDKILAQTEQVELAQQFEIVDESIGKDIHHRFEELAARLDERARESWSV